MHKHFTLILALLALHLNLLAQYPCSDFNSGDMGNWSVQNCFRYTVGSPYTNPLDLSPAISIKDNHGTSTFFNELDYQNLGARFLGKCLSFDYNVTNDAMTGKTLIHPTIYVSDILGRTIYFVANATVVEGGTWVHVRAPIAHCDWLGHAPSGTDGQWMNNKYDQETFDWIMDSCVKIYFVIDVIGSEATTEEIRFDNICVSNCQDSSSKSCNPNFDFTFTACSDPKDIRNNIGAISIQDPHRGSIYQYTWGDGSITPTPEDHKYSSGAYDVRVTEKTRSGAVCTAKLDICVSNRNPVKIAAGTIDTPCLNNFIMTLVSSSNKTNDLNNMATMALLKPEPTTAFIYSWGDGKTTFTPDDPHHLKKGEYNACITGTSRDGSTCKKCLYLCVDERDSLQPTFIHDQNSILTSKISIIPNPATDHAELEFSLVERQDVQLRIADLSGKTLAETFSQSYSSGKQRISIPTNNLVPGLYFVAFSAGSETIYEKLVITR